MSNLTKNTELTINNIGIIKGRENKRNETLLNDIKELPPHIRVDLLLSAMNCISDFDEFVDSVRVFQINNVIKRMLKDLDAYDKVDHDGTFGEYSDLLFNTLRENFCIVK